MDQNTDEFYIHLIPALCPHTSHIFVIFHLLLEPVTQVWVDPDVDGKIILRGIFRKWEALVGTGWSGLRIGTVGGHL
jgi:hypothetical protein